MIHTMMLMRILDAHHILHILHHTYYRSIARRISAYRAHILLRNVVANAAIAYLLAQTHYRLSKVHCHLLVLTQQVKHQAQCRLAPNARQLRKLAHRTLKQRRCKLLFHILSDSIKIFPTANLAIIHLSHKHTADTRQHQRHIFEKITILYTNLPQNYLPFKLINYKFALQ